jgi:hypothetical protein
MKIEVRELMDDNEMLSHIFFGCIPMEELIKIKDQYVGTEGNQIDWRTESVKIPVEMKIGKVSVNPKEFFNSWKTQMQQLILEKAQEIVAEKLGSEAMKNMHQKIYDFQTVLESWENEINWDVKNPFI